MYVTEEKEKKIRHQFRQNILLVLNFSSSTILNPILFNLLDYVTN